MKSVDIPSVTGFDQIDKFAQIAVDYVDWPAEYPYCPDTKVRLGHTADRILVRFDVEEDNVRAVCTESNGPVWEDSCVEFFAKVPGSEFYYNFETNCIGVGLSAKRVSRSDCHHFNDEEQAKVIRRSSLPLKPVDIIGGGKWSLELEVPFSVLGIDACPAELLANFYKCGDKTARTHFVSWNPIDNPTPNFHLPQFFGTLRFA